MSSCQASSNDTTLYTTLPTTRRMASSTTTSMHKSIRERQQYDCPRDNSKASCQTRRRQDATACTQQHISQNGKPTPARHSDSPTASKQAAKQHAYNTLSIQQHTTQDDAHTQHAYSRHEDNNTKTASQTTSNHAVSQTNVRYGTVQMTTMMASLAAHDA